MVPAIILAAGFSSRMGRTKALLPLPGGGWFLQRLDATLREAGVGTVVAVIGRDADAIEAAVRAESLATRLVRNPDPARGQLSSLVAGLAALPGTPPAALVIPVDLPLVSADTVRRVVAAWQSSAAPVVRPKRGGRHGHPVLFSSALFGELRAADPSAGARAVVKAHLGEVVDVPTDDQGAFDDVDTPEDYARLMGGPGWSTPPAR